MKTPFDDFEFKRKEANYGYFQNKHFPHHLTCNVDIGGAVSCIASIYRRSIEERAASPWNIGSCYGGPSWYFEYEKDSGRWFTYDTKCKKCYSSDEFSEDTFAYMEGSKIYERPDCFLIENNIIEDDKISNEQTI